MAKGALAIGVGAALLLGGGGTLATWNDTKVSGAGTIASGKLALEAGKGKWQAGKEPAASAAELPAEFQAVPGDEYSFTQPLTVTLEGNNMVADLTANNAVTSAFGNEAAVAVSYSTDGTTWTPSNQPLKASGKIHARITVTFTDMGPGGNVVANSADRKTDLNLASAPMGFKLEQRTVTQAP
ncbi:alternate-type signal peptide domain-containing protein [Arthrobacter gengyunqii]|nr:alternate-type signal peptide domain-containing protein [Arthrobacter gengyunqii]